MSQLRPDLSNPVLPDVNDLRSRQGEGSNSTTPLEWTPSSASSRDGASSSSDRKGKGKERWIGPNQAKIVAAMTGAVTTSLLMTPFDVLKTRLQTVQPHPRPSFVNGAIRPNVASEECCQTSVLASSSSSSSSSSSPASRRALQGECLTSKTSAPRPVPGQPLPFSTLRATSPSTPAPEGCLYPSKWAGIWGEAITLEQAISRTVGGGGAGSAGAGAASALALDARLLSQDAVSESVQMVGGRVGGFWNEAALVLRDTGVRGLWKGVGTTMAMGVPSSAIYMLGYEHLLGIISPYFTRSSDPLANTSSLNRPSAASGTLSSPVLTPAPLVAGSLARTLSATVISPIEMFRTRLQALPASGRPNPTYASTTADLVTLVQTKGLSILWRGLGPTLWRDVPFSGIYWANFEILKSRLTASSSYASSSSHHLSPTGISFISGALSGILAALFTQPFDVLKTRRQVFTPSPDCNPAALRHRASTLPLAAHVIRTEGWQALFAGLTPRVGKVAPACGLMIACYEGVGRWLGEK